MPLDHEIWALVEPALKAADPHGALVGIVLHLKERGVSRDSCYELFEQVHSALVAADRERDQFHVADVLDRIWGWCSPSMRLWPEPQRMAMVH